MVAQLHAELAKLEDRRELGEISDLVLPDAKVSASDQKRSIFDVN